MSTPLEARFRQLLELAADDRHDWRGTAPDAHGLDAMALGRLMPLAYRASRRLGLNHSPLSQVVRAVHTRARDVTPRYDAASAHALLQQTLQEYRDHAAEEQQQGRRASVPRHVFERSVKVIAATPEAQRSGLEGDLREILGIDPSTAKFDAFGAILFGLAGLDPWTGPSGGNAGWHASPLWEVQLRIFHRMSRQDLGNAIVAAHAVQYWTDGKDDDDLAERGKFSLAQFPEFVAASRACIERALARVRDIQAGTVPFESDAAFTVVDATALMHFVQLALERHEPWLNPMLEPLLSGVCKAPDPKLKSVPSQSATVQLAKAVAMRPTVAALQSLASAKASVRHAGLKKKLDRFHSVAKRRLAAAPDLLLHWDPSSVIPKRLMSAVVAAFEGLAVAARSFPADVFLARVLAHDGLASLASRLVWVLVLPGGDRTSAALRRQGSEWHCIDAQGRPGPALEGVVAIELWHPLSLDESTAEAWRCRAIAERWSQPFNQVFRETYVFDEAALAATSTSLFAGAEVDIKTWLAVAGKAGWYLDHHHQLVRRLGDWRFVMRSGPLHAGMDGVLAIDHMQVQHMGEAAALHRVGTVRLSEVLRTVDLMVSVASFGVVDPHAWELDERVRPHPRLQWARELRAGQRGAQRRYEVLRRLYGTEPSESRPWVDGRHVRVGDLAIHIATGQARRGGVQAGFVEPSATVSLQYPDKVLERIVAMINSA